MIALLVLGVALPLFTLVACGIVVTEGYLEDEITGHRRTRATRPASRVTGAAARRVGWLILAQTCALLVGVVIRVIVQP